MQGTKWENMNVNELINMHIWVPKYIHYIDFLT